MVNLGTVEPSRKFIRLILLLAGASLILVIVVLYFSLARATISLFPSEEPVSIEYEATIDASQAFDPSKLDQVPGRIETVEKEASKEINNVGEKGVPDFAHVTVTIHNQQGSAQGLLPRTQLVNADGIKFRTDESVNVPGGGSIQVGATADQAGKEYNVGPSRFSIIKLSPQLQQLVYAESSEDATGGERFVEAVVQEDIETAQDELIEELTKEGTDELRKRLKGTEQFISEAVGKEVLEKTSSVEANTETDSFKAMVKMKLATVVFDENNLLQLSIAKLTASIENNQELVSYEPESFSYEVASFNEEAGNATIKAKLSGVARPRLSNELFDKDQVRGLRQGEVIEHYGQFTDIDHVETSFSPFWIQTVPSIIDKINIEVGKSESIKSQKSVDTSKQNI